MALRRVESPKRFFAAVSLPLLAVILGALGYQLFVVPWVVSGNKVNTLTWYAIWGSIPVALAVAGSLVEKWSSAFWITVIVTVFRRTSAAVLAYFHAPGHLKLDIDGADFWTSLFALEFGMWLTAAAVGWLLGFAYRRGRRLEAQRPQV